MIPDAFHFRYRYDELKMPVVIIAGDEDRLIDTETQSARLHVDVSQSKFYRVSGSGHMIHQTATNQVMEAIDEVTGEGPVANRSVWQAADNQQS